MARKKKDLVAQDTPEELAGAESTPLTEDAGPEGQSGDASPESPGEPERPKLSTIEEIREEYFPGKTRFSGGAAAGLQRELRRRNRRAERGY